MLDRTLAAYGPETKAARDLLKQTLTRRISQIWPEEGGNVTLDALGGGAGIDLVQRELFTLSPQTDAQRWLPIRMRFSSPTQSHCRAGRPSSRSVAGSRGRFL